MHDLAKLKKAGHIVTLQKKDFILYSGLLLLAHSRGLLGIETEPVEIDWQNGRFVFKATVQMKDGVFTGYGDCTQHNTGKMIYPHAIRMSETRAKARALRDAVGLGLTSYEELGEL